MSEGGGACLKVYVFVCGVVISLKVVYHKKKGE